MVTTSIGDLGNSGLKICGFKNDRPGPLRRFYGSGCLSKAARWLAQHGPVTLHAACANPDCARKLSSALKRCGLFLSPVKKSRQCGLRFEYDFNRLGVDRLADAVAARADYSDSNLIVLDFGTALTVNVIEGNVFSGGFIVPSPRVMLDSLARRAAALPSVGKVNPQPVFARTTRDAMTSGAHLLFVNGVTGMLVWIVKVRGRQFRILATGGGAALAGALPFPVTRDDTLTLRGIERLARK